MQYLQKDPQNSIIYACIGNIRRSKQFKKALQFQKTALDIVRLNKHII